MAIRVLLVDDNPSHLELLRMLLDLEPEFDVVAEAVDGVLGVEAAQRVQPDLILSDIEMPRLDGLRAVPRYRAAAPAAVVALMSSLAPSEAVPAAQHAGADVYVDKGLGVETLIETLRGAVMKPRPSVVDLSQADRRSDAQP